MSYLFICNGTPQHTSHSASKEQYDPSCPECGAPTHLVEPDELAQARNRHQVEIGKKLRAMRGDGASNLEIAEALGVSESTVRSVSESLPEIEPKMCIWYPGPDYKGREGIYAQTVGELKDPAVIEFVQMRAREDGEWAIKNHLVGDNEAQMRQMMEWTSNPKNIAQCLEHVYKEENAHIRTVDWVCRDLANASKWIAGGNARD